MTSSTIFSVGVLVGAAVSLIYNRAAQERQRKSRIMATEIAVEQEKKLSETLNRLGAAITGAKTRAQSLLEELKKKNAETPPEVDLSDEIALAESFCDTLETAGVDAPEMPAETPDTTPAIETTPEAADAPESGTDDESAPVGDATETQADINGAV